MGPGKVQPGIRYLEVLSREFGYTWSGPQQVGPVAPPRAVGRKPVYAIRASNSFP